MRARSLPLRSASSWNFFSMDEISYFSFLISSSFLRAISINWRLYSSSFLSLFRMWSKSAISSLTRSFSKTAGFCGYYEGAFEWTGLLLSESGKWCPSAASTLSLCALIRDYVSCLFCETFYSYIWFWRFMCSSSISPRWSSSSLILACACP